MKSFAEKLIVSYVLAAMALLVQGCDPPPALEYSNPSDPWSESAVPSTPVNVLIESRSRTEYRLSWENQTSFTTGYLVERLPGRRGATVPDTIMTTDPFLSEMDMDTSLTYTYTVRATYRSNASRPSSPVKVRFSRNEIRVADSLDVRLVAADPNGHYLATYDGNNLVKIWSLKDYSRVDHYEFEYIPTLFRYSPQADRLAIMLPRDAFAHAYNASVWDLKAHEVCQRIRTCASDVLRFSPDGAVVAAASYDRKHLMLFSGDNELGYSPLGLFPSAIRDILYTPDGRYLIVSCDDAQMRVYDIMQGYELVNTVGVPAAAIHLAISSDGMLLGAATLNNSVYIWRMQNLSSPIQILPGSQMEINFIPHTHQVTVVNNNGILLIDAETGMVQRTIFATQPLYSYAITADGKMLVMADGRALRFMSLGDIWWTIP